MAIRRREEDTGLNPSDIYSADTPEDFQGLLRLGAQLQAVKEANWLDELEREAQKKRDSPSELEAVRRDASLVCIFCQRVRTLIATGVVRDVKSAYPVFELGRAAKMFHIRPREPDVMLGKKDRAIRTKGGKKRAQSRRAEWDIWQSDIDRQCRSGLTHESACTNTASKFGRDLSTIKRRTTNPKPRSSCQKKSAQ